MEKIYLKDINSIQDLTTLKEPVKHQNLTILAQVKLETAAKLIQFNPHLGLGGKVKSLSSLRALVDSMPNQPFYSNPNVVQLSGPGMAKKDIHTVSSHKER